MEASKTKQELPLCQRLGFPFSCLETISEHLHHRTGENQLKKKSFINWSLCCLINIIYICLGYCVNAAQAMQGCKHTQFTKHPYHTCFGLINTTCGISGLSMNMGSQGRKVGPILPPAEGARTELMPASRHGRAGNHHPDLASPGDVGAADLPERAGQGPASPALLGTRPWGLKIEQIHDSDTALGTIPSQKDKGLGLLARVRRVLFCAHTCTLTPPHAQWWESALQSNPGDKARLLLHPHHLGRQLGPPKCFQWPLSRCTASAQGRMGSSSTQHEWDECGCNRKGESRDSKTPTHCSERAGPLQPSETPKAALWSSVRPSTLSPPRHEMGMVGSCSSLQQWPVKAWAAFTQPRVMLWLLPFSKDRGTLPAYHHPNHTTTKNTPRALASLEESPLAASDG